MYFNGRCCENCKLHFAVDKLSENYDNIPLRTSISYRSQSDTYGVNLIVIGRKISGIGDK